MLQRTKQIKPLPLWKRCFDLGGASIGLVVLSPLLLLIAIHIKLTSKGPVFFKHKRFGYRGLPLYVWKFRSLHVDSDPDHHKAHVMNMVVNNGAKLEKINVESQLIPGGKWLRNTALDELPQLFNVFRGEMSLVGPRPDVVPMDQYQSWQQKRFDVMPGLTGLWQVSGKNHTTFNEMNQLDAFYVDHRCLWLDVKIVALTVPAIVKQVAEDWSAESKITPPIKDAMDSNHDTKS